MTPVIEGLCRWLIDYYALATMLLAGVLLGGLLLRQPARWINLSWAATAGLIGLAVITAFQGFIPVAIPVFTAQTAEPIDLASAPATVQDTPMVAPGPEIDAFEVGPLDRRVPEIRSVDRSWKVMVVGFFSIGALLVLCWLLLGAVLTARLQRTARLASESIQSLLRKSWRGSGTPPVVFVSNAINQALAAGVLNPIILLPEWFETQESARSIQAVLGHEVAHISNRDLWLRAQQRWLMLILFAHPLYWLLRAATQANQEYLADATARGNEPLNYAEILLHWFRTGAAGRNRALTVTVGLWERPHLLKRRIAMVLNEKFHVERSCPSRWRLAVWSVVSVSVLALSCITLHGPSTALAQESKDATQAAPEKASPDKGADATAKANEPKKDSSKEPRKEINQPKFTEAQIAKAKSKYTSADEAYGVGAARYNSRKFAESREPLEAALVLAPDAEYRIRVYRALLASYRQLATIDQFVEASEYIIQNSDRDAEQSLTRRSLLSFLHERGKMDPYIKRHEERLKVAPQDRLSLYVLSEIYSDYNENPARSIELLKQLSQLDGNKENTAVDVNVSAKLAMQHVRAKEFQKGAELFEQIAAQDEKLAAWHWKEAANAWLKLKENDKALAAAKKSAEAAPEKRSELLTHFWHRQLGDVFLATGQAELAIPHFEQAIASTKIEGYVKDCQTSLAEAKKKAGK